MISGNGVEKLEELTLSESYLLGLRFFKSQNFEGAIELFTKIIETDECHVLFDAYAYRGMSYIVLGFLEDARKDYEEYLKYAPNDADALNTLGSIYALLGQWELAKSLFERSLLVNARQESPHRNLAAYYRKSGFRYFFKFLAHLWRARCLRGNREKMMTLKMPSGTLDILVPKEREF
jgi:tetratricopeptide (TPR) repeat protein